MLQLSRFAVKMTFASSRPLMPDLPQHFANTLALLNVSDANGAAWQDIRLRYSEPGRHYHNLEHVSHCLDELSRTKHDTATLRLAIYYHDIIHDPCGDDNEMLSARFATETLGALGLTDRITSVVYDLIRATDHRPSAPVPHGDLVCDIDLSVLGSSPIDYHTYSSAIRREYSWLPESRYRRGRTNILTALLDRPTIYLTSEFQRRLEDQARINLVSEITELRG